LVEDLCGECPATDGVVVSVVLKRCGVAPKVPGVFVCVVLSRIVDTGVYRAACEPLVDGSIVCILIREPVPDLERVVVISVAQSALARLIQLLV
jgi:hypothetical protein